MQLVPRHEGSFIILVCAYILIKHKSQHTKLNYYVSFSGLQAIPDQLLDHLLLEESVDDSYLLLTYQMFLTSPGQIFYNLVTSWNERTEVHDRVSMCACVCVCH